MRRAGRRPTIASGRAHGNGGANDSGRVSAHMKRILAFAVLAATIVAACTSTTTTSTPSGSASTATGQHPKIGLVTDVGGLNDKSFNALADAGRLQAQSQLDVTTSVTES